jgi:hypothetical protein
MPPERIAAFGVRLMAAAVAGMLYHLYLGRFEQVWTARGVFLWSSLSCRPLLA